ncbi:MarR family transcriptional regulator [Lactobacillus sp. S2-2]|uniref:MarR family winged helix-turn-helix transcriptional regulator n=1 Tax=Lactobacillus sp. S2-2 TaxID=2692917 RepID=UPI001F3F6879|nr:MarR family transcriptional regulator [Lactobacillus sp. S2-2]MCF6515176.1 MarR family transcriptional regulator [Lactobacillus sp. S2-2]
MSNRRQIEAQLCFGIYNANKRFNRYYQKVLDKYKLTYPQYICLLTLWEHEVISVKDLGSYIDLDSGTLTPLLRRMDKQGWICKEKSKKDERVVLIKVTEYANKQKSNILSEIDHCFDELNLSDKNYERCLKLVNEVSNKLDKINKSESN